VVDQFEELFTVCGSEAERSAFISWLWQVAGDGARGGPMAVVACGLRADFYGECSRYPQLRRALVADQVLVGPMSADELTEAIVCPAQATGLDVEPGLAEILLRDLGVASAGDAGLVGGYDAGRLPLLAHALQAAWQQRHGSWLTVDGYRATGGILRAVAMTAERAFSGLDPAARQEAQRVFLRLVRISDTGEDVRRRGTREDLLRDSRQPALAQAVLDAFTGSRLLTQDRDVVEITHEALIRGWPRLRQWIGQDRSGNLNRQVLHEAASDWDRNGHDPSYLYRGTRLQAATETATRLEADPAHYAQLSPTERSFLQASGRAVRRATRWRQAAIAGLTALTVAAAMIAVIAVQDVVNASRQHAIALSQQLAAESLATSPTDALTARQLAVAAWSVYPTDQADSAMTTLLAEQQQDSLLPADDRSAVAFSSGGRLLATIDKDGTVQLWNVATGQPARAPIRAGAGSSVTQVAFSPDGRLLATADKDGGIRLWNLASGQLAGVPIPAGIASGRHEMAFSPDGRLLATVGKDGGIRLWNLASGQLAGVPIPAGIASTMSGVAFSPDGELIAAADGANTIRLWNPATGQPAGRPILAGTGTGGVVFGVAFSPEGKLATANADDIVQLWDPATGQPAGPPIRAVTATGTAVLSMAFSPDGRFLAATNDADTIQLWDPATGQPAGTPLAVGSGVFSVAFSPDSRLLATAALNGIRLWNAETGQPISASLNADPGGAVSGVAFSRDGRLLATADADGTVRLWNPSTGQAAGRPIPVGTGAIDTSQAVFSPDGRLLAIADNDGAVQIWELSTGRVAGRPIPVGTGAITASQVAFSPDGRLLAIADNDGAVQIWDLSTGQPVGTPIPIAGGARAVAFTPDGKLLAAAAANGTVRLWSLASRQPAGASFLTAPTSNVSGLAFSPDGRLLAITDVDGTIQLWNPAAGKPVGGPLPTGGTSQAVFSPDGRLLATADNDGTVRLWAVPLFASPYQALCADVGPPTTQEWSQYAPGEPFPHACH
jgi:WD40 repeat protein